MHQQRDCSDGGRTIGTPHLLGDLTFQRTRLIEKSKNPHTDEKRWKTDENRSLFMLSFSEVQTKIEQTFMVPALCSLLPSTARPSLFQQWQSLSPCRNFRKP
jgi:hypothetical protein